MLRQAAHNRHLGAQHVAFGHGSDDFLRRSFQPRKCAFEIDLGHGDDERGLLLAVALRRYLRARSSAESMAKASITMSAMAPMISC